MITKTINLETVRGDTMRFGITINNLENSTVDAIYFSVKKYASDMAYLIQKSLDDGIELDSESETTKYVITILPEDTENLPAPRDYPYDIEITLNSGDVITLVEGKLSVLTDITRHLDEEVEP